MWHWSGTPTNARAFAKPDAAKVIVDRALQLAEPKR